MAPYLKYKSLIEMGISEENYWKEKQEITFVVSYLLIVCPIISCTITNPNLLTASMPRFAS